MATAADVKSLFYITHVDNLPSIVRYGILSHAEIESRQVPYTRIYDAAIVSNRKKKETPDHKSLWEYANVYFQARNPMLYRVVHEKGRKELAVVGVKPDVLRAENVLVTDGNAANNVTRFFRAAEGIKAVQEQWPIIQAEYWKNDDGSKRKIMAECLVPQTIPPENIHTVFVADHETRDRVQRLLGSSRVPIVPEPNLFFQPRFSKTVGGSISLVEGDMFFSGMQTLTVSVNLQGIMGKGLASRAKYQFPDVYVVYQDACRSKRITATKPYLYKREASFDDELADEASDLSTPNAVKWFLLFATKRKWQENSRIEDIEGGLSWLGEHFASEGILSIALPALGCGLGRLKWADVGPLMCRCLHAMKIPAAIYLPRERGTDNKYLSEEYLLAGAR
jgi:hypothetical protein